MTNRNIIIGVIVVLIVAAGAWYWMSSTNTAGAPSTTASSTDTSTSAATGGQGTTIAGTGTLRTLVTQGGNYTCTLTATTAGGGQTMGTIYSAGGKTRLDFQSTVNGQTVTIHTLRSGTTAYTWVDGQSVGTKATITASSAIVPQPTGGTISDDSQVSSECHPWSPVASDLVVPAGITF